MGYCMGVTSPTLSRSLTIVVDFIESFNENIGCSLPQGLLLLMHQKKQKCFQQRSFFAARAFALQTGQNHGLGKFAPCFAALTPRFGKNSLCPSRPRPTTFCPLFYRSLSADQRN